MSIRWYSVVVDCQDIAAQSRWWAEARVGWVELIRKSTGTTSRWPKQ